MKLVHAADLHLESPIRGLVRYPGAPVRQFERATRRACSRLVSLCLEQRVGLLLLAGDVFDAAARDYQTGLYFVREMTRLLDVGARVLVVWGNHDAASHVARNLLLPSGIGVLGANGPETVRIDTLGVAVHGQSYSQRAAYENLAREYPPPLAGYLNVGLLHTSSEGRRGHDPYAPCTVRQLIAHGYDYWALGHVHRCEVLARRPWVVYSGSPQGRSLREEGPHGVVLVEADSGRVQCVRHCSVDVVRLGVCPIAVHDATSVEQVLASVQGALSALSRTLGERCLGLRLLLRGMAGVTALLGLPPETRLSVLGAAASRVPGPGVWVESVWADVPGTLGSVFRLDFAAEPLEIW